MSAHLLDGKVLAQKIKDNLKKEVQELREKYGQVPSVVNIMVGEEKAALTYAQSQQRVAEYMGIQYKLQSLPSDILENKLIDLIHTINHDHRVHGVMIHKPVPKQIDYATVCNAIHADKALEGINIANFGKMFTGEAKIFPCTAAAVMEHIFSTGVSLAGKEAIVVGRSEIVGKPVALLLLKENATVTVCHSKTSQEKLIEHLSRADIVVAAVGKPNFIKGAWIKKGAVVIDVGINQVGEKIVGDVEFETAKEKAAFITPVPGGVGPLTVTILMRNAVEAFKLQVAKESKQFDRVKG